MSSLAEVRCPHCGRLNAFRHFECMYLLGRDEQTMQARCHNPACRQMVPVGERDFGPSGRERLMFQRR